MSHYLCCDRFTTVVGFQVDAAKFFIFVLVLSLTSIAAASIAFSISAIVRVAGLANLFIAMLFVFQMVCVGVFVVSCLATQNLKDPYLVAQVVKAIRR